MRAKNILIVLLVLVSLGLGVVLLRQQKQAVEQHALDTDRALSLSNSLSLKHAALTEQVAVNQSLETNLAERVSEVKTISNKLADVATTLAKTEAKAEADIKAAQEALAQRDAKISDLEGKNDDMLKKMNDLLFSSGADPVHIDRPALHDIETLCRVAFPEKVIALRQVFR